MMASASGGSECLFSATVPLFLRTGAGAVSSTPGIGSSQSTLLPSTASPFESTRRLDTVTIEVLLTPNVSGRRNVELRLADNGDPFFYWQVSLGEDEFYALRREQNLLVDYARFPFKLIELLQQCLAHAREERPIFSVALQIEGDLMHRPATAQFSVCEFTTFRQINHLTLRLNSANEHHLRKHVNDLFRLYKDEISGLRSQLSDTHRIGLASKLGSEGPPYAGGAIGGGPLHYGAGAGAGAPVNPSLGYNPYSATDFGASVDRTRSLEITNQQLLVQKNAIESELLEARSRAQLLQDENKRLREGMGAAGGTTLQTGLQAQIAGLEAALREKSQEIQRLSSALDQQRESGRMVGTAATGSANDIVKANEIIRKLQDELKLLRNRVRTAETSAKQQEKLSRDMQKSYDSGRVELQETRDQLAEKNKLVSQLEADKAKLVAELEETKKVVEANEKIIEWLHQQLSESALDDIFKRNTTDTTAERGRILSPETLFGKAKLYQSGRSAAASTDPSPTTTV